MPGMKNMKKTTIGKKGQFNTHTTNPSAGKADSRKGFVRGSQSHGVTAETMGAGRKAGSGGKAMGTAKGRGGRSY